MNTKEQTAVKLIKALEDYITLLEGELEEVITIAHFHGWRSIKYEQGKEAREKIKTCKQAL